MTGILFILFLVFWFVAIRWIINLSFKYALNKERVESSKKIIFIKRLLIFLLFMSPFAKATIIHLYQEITFPIICNQGAGFENIPNITISSILNEGTRYEHLALANIDFVEWENNGSNLSNSAQKYDLGMYRFSHFPNGSRECVRLLNIDDTFEASYNFYEQKYIQHGFTLKNTDGMCVGVEKVSELKASFAFLREEQNDLSSVFGYEYNQQNTQIISLPSEWPVKQYRELSTSSETPFFNWVIPQTYARKFCTAHKDFLNENSVMLKNDNLIPILLIKRELLS